MLGTFHLALVQALVWSDLPNLQCLAWASIVRADDARIGERAHCQSASQVGKEQKGYRSLPESGYDRSPMTILL